MKTMQWLDQYIGIPYKQLNCWQLICRIYQEQFNIQLPTFETEYANGKDKDHIRKIYEREMKRWRQIERYAFKDIISIRITGQPWHAAMVIDNDSMIHTMPHNESCVERFTSYLWKSRILGFYRYVK